MKRAFCFIFSVIFTLFSLSGCNIFSGFQSSSCTKTDYVFGTVITATVYGDVKKADEAIEQCFDRFNALDDIFSLTIENSELNQLNDTAYNEPFKASDELFYVIDTALEYCKMSNRALDISIGGLTRLWGIGTDNAKVPSESEITTFSGVNYKTISLDENDKTIRFTDERVKIDLGAVVKGFAGDEALKILESYCSDGSISGGIISIGGNIVTIGCKSDKSAFNVGISGAYENAGVIATVSSSDEFTAVTSGDYQRYFEQDGIKYHHILDANTGYPANSGLSAVTIFTDSSIVADCLSTACFVLGLEAGKSLVESIDGVAAMFITNDGTISTTSGVSDYNFCLTVN